MKKESDEAIFLLDGVSYTQDEVDVIGIALCLEEKVRSAAIELFETAAKKKFPESMPVKVDFNPDTACLGPVKGPLLPTKESRRHYPFG